MLLKVLLSFFFINYVQADRKNDTCGCHILGTVANVDGESLCNEKTLQCKCLPNVRGLNCDQCAKDHYGLFSGRGCSKCNCSPFGSNTTQCNTTTGTCTCRDGYTGSQCNECALNNYEYELFCVPCYCNIMGSRNLQCDRNGQCPCLENVEGYKCELCKENTYNMSEGCKPCPSSYNLVQNASSEYAKDLHKTDVILRQIEYNLSVIIQDFENFVEQLKELYSKIDALMSFDNLTVSTNIDDLFVNLDKKLTIFQDDVAEVLKKANEFNIDELSAAIEKVKMSLEESKDLLKKCVEELELAKTRSEELGTHNKTITNIAENSTAVLETISKKSEEALMNADDIKVTAKDICDGAEAFEAKQKKIQDDVEVFSINLNETRNNALTMQTDINEFSSETNKTHTVSTELDKKANEITIPDDQEILTETAIIKYDYVIVEGKIDDTSNISAEFKDTMDSTENYLAKVQNRENILNDELILLNKDKENADVAVEELEKLITTAQKDYDEITEFQNMHQKIKDLMETVPNISEKIKAVQDNHKETNQVFVQILDIIETNKNLAAKVDEILNEIEANETIILNRTENVDQLLKEHEGVSESLTKLDIDLKNLVFNHDKLKKVEAETEEKVQQLQLFSLVLNTIPLDESNLDDIDLEMSTVESMFDSIDILLKEKKKLEDEIESIKDILQNLPGEDSTLCEAPESEPKLGVTDVQSVA
ncbi:hypothetical protein FQR65_LT04751 [Abscondita terminalis]|nr:hypothetical protein FQR65_LT04751 [Abscondita terminalis]